MRSPFVLAANIAALRLEIEDNLYSLSHMGFAREECDKLQRAKEALRDCESTLRSFRYIKSVSDPAREKKQILDTADSLAAKDSHSSSNFRRGAAEKGVE